MHLTGSPLRRALTASGTGESAPAGPAFGFPPIEPRQLAIGAGVIVVGLLLARVVRVVVRWWLARAHTPSYARVFASLAAFGVGALAVGTGLTIAFPSVQPVDILGGLGIASVAIGIAFQNVLANLFAGVLILVRQPFRAGDQIAVGDTRGTVEEVNLRETVVRTFDGRRVLVPNSTVHGEVLTVQTGYAHIRTTVVIGVDHATDLARARTVVLDAVRGVPGVAGDPAPQCLLTELASSTINFDLRFWSGARQLETLETRDRVIEAVVRALTDAGVDMPADIRVVQPSSDLMAAIEQRSTEPREERAVEPDG